LPLPGYAPSSAENDAGLHFSSLHRVGKMIDLYQIRRDLIAMRSRHSENIAVTKRINKLLGKIAHVREPESRRHEARVKQLVAKATEELVTG
jgi:response regulator RpfG family c-di-GMP phosphodiesterase